MLKRIRILSGIVVSLGLGMSLSPAFSRAAVCTWPKAPQSILSNTHTNAQSWTIPETEVLWSEEIPEAPALVSMIRWVEGFVPSLDQRFLLQRQRGFYERGGLRKDVDVFDRVLDGRLGEIRKSSCIELLLLEAHLNRFQYGEHSTEFQAIILRRKNAQGTQLKVYQASGDGDGFPPTMGIFMKSLVRDLSEGWGEALHIHNHPFSQPSRPHGDFAGTVIPSAPDLHTYQELRKSISLQEARVTNGIDSLRINVPGLPLETAL